MIVYYESEKYSIIGLSYKHDPLRSDLYIETDDPRAENIFLNTDKPFFYEVIVDSTSPLKGKLRRKGAAKVKSLVSESLHLITNHQREIPDVKLSQDNANKTITISITNFALNFSKENNIQFFTLAACRKYDPYQLLWTRIIYIKDFVDNNLTFNYTGMDDICFYTKKVFHSYYYETKSI
jgi:hypothetical protein